MINNHQKFDPQTIYQRADCLFNQKQITAVIKTMAEAITEVLGASNPLVICIMNGGLIFSGQLLTQLNFPLQVDYLHASRYSHKIQGEALNWRCYPQLSLKNRTVLLVDDILDEGNTLIAVKKYCIQQGAISVKTAVLADKQHQRKIIDNLKADFWGVEVVDRFLFGYGLDFKGYWRNAPGIFALHPDDQK